MYQSIPNVAGVYLITNTVTGKVYVGSARRMRARIQRHRSQLIAGSHHSALLQRAWTKYGEAEFSASIIGLCEVGELRAMEQSAIDARGAADRGRGYNLNPSAAPGRCMPHSEETKRRIGAGNKGKGGALRSGWKQPPHAVEIVASRYRFVGPPKHVMEAAWAASRGNSFHRGYRHDDETRTRMSEKTRGELHPRARLTDEAVHEIRAARGRRGMPRILADRFGVSLSTIYETQRGRYWRHIGPTEVAS